MRMTDLVDDVEKVFEPRFEDRDIAIRVLRLHKIYRNFRRSKIVLNGLNLNCQAKKLYILYGTGKSGKSAVVKSILHMETFSRGAISIFNKSDKSSYSDVGYMPQIVGLDDCLTAIETIHYFANLQNLNKHDCVKNFSAMQSPMTISEYSTLVHNLNFDQRRVLSFYIAIMASPKIVILDQPLAGCDPLYKHFFWLKLRSMVDNEGTTVFMTCADEVDVKYADTVGYLRNGQIIAEQPPADLMKRYNIWSFNDLIFSISVAELKEFQIEDVEYIRTIDEDDDDSIKSGGFAVTHFTSSDDTESLNKRKINFTVSESHIDANDCQSLQLKDVFKQLWVLIKWQTLISVRNYTKVFVNLILPTLCVVFYGLSVGNEMAVNLGIVCCKNESSQYLKMEIPTICEFGQSISPKYLYKTFYDSYDDAAKGAEAGELGAILLLNANPNITEKNQEFGCQSRAFTTTNVVLEVVSSSKLVRSHIIDQISRTYGGSQDNPLISVVTYSQSLTENAKQCLTECPITPFVSTFKYKNSGKYESELMLLIWGAIATISHFSGAITGALPLCVQNRNGLVDRMKIIDITHYKIQIVHWATRTLFILAQNLLLLISSLLFLKELFSARQIFTGWFAITLQSLCGFSFGILLFAIFKKQVTIILSLIVLELIISSLSGFFWNYYGLYEIFKRLTIILPHHAVSKLLFEVLVNDASFVQNNIWAGFVSPLFWMLSTLVIYCVYTATKI